MTGTGPEDRPAFSAAALDEWTQLVECVLRGLAHALNNRAAAVSAAVELASDPTEDAGIVASILSPEMERIAELVAIVRTLSVPRPSEAFLPADAAKDALAILRIHPDHRDRHFAFDGSGSTPIRAPRWLFARATVMSGVLAARANADVTIGAEDRDGWLEVRATPTRKETSAYLTEAARAMGGEILPDAIGFRVPTLATLRRREGRAG